jgi:hypothetical protein
MSMPYARLRVVLAVVSFGAALVFEGAIPSVSFTGRAEARVGRPLTPMSYAGVARRTTRRTAAYGAAAGAAAAGAYYYSSYPAPGCVQAVNSYGQIVYRCP